jgi:multiple sugar transport system substrate-binding protein
MMSQIQKASHRERRVYKNFSMSSVAILIILALGLIFSLTGCSPATPGVDTSTPELSPTPEPSPVPPAPTEEIPTGPLILNLWIPLQFDPQGDSPAGKLLAARLDEFTTRRSGVIIETRIKDVEGPGGIADTLRSANAAAPLALPDLVALPYATLQSTAAEGLLHPFDGLTAVMDDPDWYEYARQFSHIQNNVFGIPFAGDALLMVYRPEIIESPPANWAALAELGKPLAFAAAAPNALFPLTLYRASGGLVIDEEAHPVLEVTPLSEVLNFFSQGSRSGYFPFSLTQFETQEQLWSAYQEGQADMVITWASRYLQAPLEDSTLAGIPTANSIPYSTGTGWAWALTSTDPQRQELAAELAEFLTTAGFLAEWDAAAGYLPPRPSALTTWEDNPQRNLLIQVSQSAQLVPTNEILGALSPALSSSTISVLKDQADPDTAAQSAVDMLVVP